MAQQTTRSQRVILGVLVAAAGSLSGLGGCASKNDAPPKGATASAPAGAGTVVEPAKPAPKRFNPIAVSSAGLIANRPADISAPRPETTAAAATQNASTENGAIAFQPRPTARTEPSNAATGLYGQIMAHSMNAAGDPAAAARGAGVNVLQISHAIEGADFDPDVSPKGDAIVFASTQHRPTADLYIKSVTGRTVTKLTNDPANDIMPRVSPDGTRIAFASDRSGTWCIYVMPIDGGRAIQITSGASDDLHPSWSPDGQQLVFSRLGHMSGQWEIWTTDVANQGEARFIGYGLFPDWCPQPGTGPQGGDLIAFQKSRERGDRSFGIWTIEFKDGQAQNATEIAASPSAACINPSWSRDGAWIAFSTVPNAAEWAGQSDGRPTQADLWMVDLQGTSRINLTSGLAVNLMPTFGPDHRLYFVSDRGGLDHVWAMDTTKVVALAALNNPQIGQAVARGQATRKNGPAPSKDVAAGESVEAPGEGE